MSWLDELRPASFRGVPFEVVDANRGLGRKVARHDFPLRDFATGEDMGLNPGEFRVQAIVIGNDYMTARDALEVALNKPGTGPLILPWTGQRTVRLMSASAVESAREGGMVTYDLVFMPEDNAPPPVQTPDTSADVASAGSNAQTQANTAFTNIFTVANQPSFVTTAAANVIGQISDQIDSLTAPLKAQVGALDGFVAQGLALRSQVLNLVTQPAELAASISGLIQGIRTVASTPADALTALEVLLGFAPDLPSINVTTPARQAQVTAQAAVTTFVQQTAAAEAVQAVADIDFVAYDDAVATRDTIGDLIDTLAYAAADAGDGASWQTLSAARQAMIRDVTARGGSLAHLVNYTPPTAVPVLVLAYGLYDDTTALEDNAADIITRNGILYPGFVRGGIPLQVLSDV